MHMAYWMSLSLRTFMHTVYCSVGGKIYNVPVEHDAGNELGGASVLAPPPPVLPQSPQHAHPQSLKHHTHLRMYWVSHLQ